MIQRETDALGGGGLPYTPLLVLGGVPLKVYAAIACSLGLPLVALLLWTAFARLVRIAPTFLLAGAARLLFRRRIDAHPAAWCAALGAWWGGLLCVLLRAHERDVTGASGDATPPKRRRCDGDRPDQLQP
jgi:hypothetical protein